MKIICPIKIQITGYSFEVSEDGKTIKSIWTQRVLAQCACKKGYLRVWSSGHARQRRSFLVHRLVALAYLECPEGYQNMDVNHKDGNKQNNHFSNLEWVTHKDNMRHAEEQGLWRRENGGRITKKDERDFEIIKDFENGTSRADLCIKHNVSRANLSRIIRNNRSS